MFRAILLCFCFVLSAQAAPEDEKKSPSPAPLIEIAPVSRESSIEIAGQKIPYKVTAGKILLKQDDGKARASIFHVDYERTDAPDPASRPVMFAFNGGPGSSSMWLHIGLLGPKTVKIPGDGTISPPPPVCATSNPLSPLDVCDLVFIDPVSTGYSRAENGTKPSEFHGVDEDIQSVGDFIRRWVSEHNRWASPKFLIGESYGGVRAAGLSQHLQSRYAMNFNGVILLSTLLDFATLSPSPGSDLPFLVYLPSFTSAAHFHGKIQGEKDALISRSTEFAFGEYASALLKGNELAPDERKSLAGKLAELTGISAETWLEHDLRIDPTFFRVELLRKEGKILGRFDARVTGPGGDSNGDSDPSFSLAYGAMGSAMMDYLGREIGYKEERPYEILTSVQPWRWNSENSLLNLSASLSHAMRDNPHLRVLVMGGQMDFATPSEGIAYSIRHIPNLSAEARKNIIFSHFQAGHMFYLNPLDLEKTRKDLLNFLKVP